ncbi:Neuronal acetylcholine receptor subunit alpha-6 [Chionoecetes opilio]|uniref:Neuronal acetylcholine receptor subunit alpha-6 n=1 Tax=Chionoecetes opilio TaxID=41210 RepID=A0A8J4YHX5_CHIOP|nr:Neuronal acetylcholine receptor subunit alpha-6 [Chionoecetes opilio]
MATWRLLVVATAVLALCLPRQLLADGQQDLSPEERLKKKLLDGYDKSSLPHRQNNDTTVVEFSMMLQGSWIEEDKQIININAWVLMTWMDPRLTWDHKDYGGLDNVHFGDHEVWQPGIVLYNNADVTKVDPYGGTDLVIKDNGRVWWVPPATLRAECPLDVTYWPYDTQVCYLYLGSWTKEGYHMDIQIYANRTKVSAGYFMKLTHAWQYKSGKLVRIVSDYPDLNLRYVMLQMTVSFARVSPIFTYTVVFPAIVVSVLTLLQFVLPMREPRRLLLGCVSLLLTLMHLIYLAATVPTLSSSVPIVVKFFGQTLAVTVASVGVSALLLRLTDTRQPTIATPPPIALKTLLTGPAGTFLFLRQYIAKVGMSGGGAEDGEVLEDSDARPASHHYEWLLVAAATDRVAFLAFLATFFITFIAYVAAV